MKISLIRGKVEAKEYTCESLEILNEITKNSDWSPFLFNNDYRASKNFISTEFLVFDIDEGMPFRDAKMSMDELNIQYVINFSKSHQIRKGTKSSCDRFRVIIPLGRIIRSKEEYLLLWKNFSEQYFSKCDSQCKDTSRFYYASIGKGEEVIRLTEKKLDPDLYIKPEKEKVSYPPNYIPDKPIVQKFVNLAHTGLPGTWNITIYKVAICLCRIDFTEEKIIDFIQKYAPEKLDVCDLKTIKSGIKTGLKAGVYQRRENYHKIGRELFTPIFNKKFVIYQDEVGVRNVLKRKEKECVSFVSIEYLLALGTTLFEEQGYFISPALIKSIITNYINAASPIYKMPKSIALLDDTELAFERLAFKPQDTPSPLFDEFIANCTNGKALMAFIWSLFETKSSRQQYVWLSGEGGDGKGAITRFLDKLLQSAYSVETSVGISSNKHYTSSFIGKRLVVFPDVNNPNVVLSELFKMITGGDKIKIDPKGKSPYFVYLDTKLILTSNTRPNFSSQRANLRRAIITEVIPRKITYDPEYESKLYKEKAGILFKCKEAYGELVKNHGEIEVDTTVAMEITEDFNEELESIFSGLFELDEESVISNSDFFHYVKEPLLRYRIGYMPFKKYVLSLDGVRVERKSEDNRQRKIRGIRILSDHLPIEPTF